MELYKCKIHVSTPKKYHKHYYWNLWSFTHLLGNDFYTSIVAISPLIKSWDDCFFLVTIKWEISFKKLLNYTLWEGVYIDIDSEKLHIQSVDYNFSLYKPGGQYEAYKNIEISFLSPTIIKKEMHGIDINQILPVPEVFLWSCIRKYTWFYEIDTDIDAIKQEIWWSIIVGSFNMRSERVKIKNNYKAWVVWKIKYTCIKNLKPETRDILYESLRYCHIAGIWSGTKLWLWQVKILFHKNNTWKK